MAAQSPAVLSTTPSPRAHNISVTASRTRVPAGTPVTLSGRVKHELTRVKVDLYSIPWPYKKGQARLVASTTTAGDGSFSFTRNPGVNTRYHATISGTHIHAAVLVHAVAKVVQWEKALPLGRAKIVVVLFHPKN